ncbi:flagellin [Halobacillus seohaensis]|uniref:Flagellin n=1 Tax=Halobacillus seohaensis TaxID=447421 RepID=A0ABW2EMY0_9BACI
MRSLALGVTGNDADVEITDEDGNVIESAASKAVKSVTDGTYNEKTGYALDVSSYESAAVTVINNVIESVSAERSSLGASQNRLEHTISNLNNAI